MHIACQNLHLLVRTFLGKGSRFLQHIITHQHLHGIWITIDFSELNMTRIAAWTFRFIIKGPEWDVGQIFQCCIQNCQHYLWLMTRIAAWTFRFIIKGPEWDVGRIFQCCMSKLPTVLVRKSLSVTRFYVNCNHKICHLSLCPYDVFWCVLYKMLNKKCSEI